MAAKPGNIALLSQSGAIATSLIDWAADNDVGFSHIVSLGDMADVDVGDWLDMLAGDAKTRAIVMYLETIPNARKFMSAARAAARIKPVIAIKSGRHEAAAKAAATHTGALSGADRVVDAALQRAGILRVDGLAELFDAAEITARFAPLDRARVGIVTNGGGAGVLAVDQLIDCKGELAELSPATIERLNAALPPTWSHANPVDIIGDAPPERYKAAVEAVAADPGTDVVLVLNCPTGLASPAEAARAVAASGERREGSTASRSLTCWLGEHTARRGPPHPPGGRAWPASRRRPMRRPPSPICRDWSRAQKALMRVPSSRSEDVAGDREAVLAIFRQVAKDGRSMLTEPEAKAAIAAYGIPVPETVSRKIAGGRRRGSRDGCWRRRDKVVVKLLSKAISHKSDIGGVVLNIETPAAAEQAARAIAGPGARAGAGRRHRRLCRAADGGAQACAGTDPRHEPRSDLRSGDPVRRRRRGGRGHGRHRDRAAAARRRAGRRPDRAHADRPTARRLPRPQAGRPQRRSSRRSTDCRR